MLDKVHENKTSGLDIGLRGSKDLKAPIGMDSFIFIRQRVRHINIHKEKRGTTKNF